MSVVLPWIEGGTGSQIGLSQPDGLLTLIVGAAAVLTAWRGTRAGWMVAGFLAALLGRDITLLINDPVLDPAVGLLLGGVAFAAASIVQLFGLAARVRSAARSDDAQNLTGDGVDLDG